jgi:DNA-binding XRE family transcriptional regulator
MPTAPDNHDAHDYAERIRERLPRRLQELRERCGLSMFALWMKCGVSRGMIISIEGGESIPKLHGWLVSGASAGHFRTMKTFSGK